MQRELKKRESKPESKGLGKKEERASLDARTKTAKRKLDAKRKVESAAYSGKSKTGGRHASGTNTASKNTACLMLGKKLKGWQLPSRTKTGTKIAAYLGRRKTGDR